MKKYVMAGLGILLFGAISTVHAEMEVKVKDNTANNGFSIKEETTGSTIARFRGDGKVGIGTTDPTARFEVQNSAKSDLFIFSKQPPAVGNTAELLFSTTNAISLLSNAPRIYSYEEVSGAPWKMGLRFDTYASLPGPGRTNALAITGDGNVGIGTTDITNKMHVKQNDSGTTSILNIEQAGTGDSKIKYQLNSFGAWYTGIDTSDGVKFKIGTAESFDMDVFMTIVHPTGNVGIGTTNPAYKLDVNGTIRGSNVSPSDMRWKEHVKTLDNSLEKVSKLRGVSFEWKDKAKGAGKQIGLIAQEVEKVFPEVVSEDNEGYKSVAYDKLVGVLVESIKELKAQKDAEVAALKAEIEALKASVSNNVRVVAQ